MAFGAGHCISSAPAKLYIFDIGLAIIFKGTCRGWHEQAPMGGRNLEPASKQIGLTSVIPLTLRNLAPRVL